ncbi:Heat shock 70 kDa protein BIP2 [Linum perenne]
MEAGGEVVIRIDLGTIFFCVAVARDDTIEIIANDQGNHTTPSFVAFSSDSSDRLIGEGAKNQATLNPRRTFFDVKRLIGKKFDDPEVQNDIKYLSYPMVNIDGKSHVELVDLKNGQVTKAFSAEEMSAMVLGKMKETVES